MSNRGKLQIRVIKTKPMEMTAILSSFFRLSKKRNGKNYLKTYLTYGENMVGNDKRRKGQTLNGTSISNQIDQLFKVCTVIENSFGKVCNFYGLFLFFNF